MGGQVRVTADLDETAKKNICPYKELNPQSPLQALVTALSYPCSQCALIK
jgi:hypothetical protein